jgi:hypothetical protein
MSAHREISVLINAVEHTFLPVQGDCCRGGSAAGRIHHIPLPGLR